MKHNANIVTPTEYLRAVTVLLNTDIDKRLVYALTDYIHSMEVRMDNPQSPLLPNPSREIIHIAFDPCAIRYRAYIETVLVFMDHLEAALSGKD